MKPEGASKLYVVPCRKEQASDFINHIHRHHLPLGFGSYTLAVCTGDGVVHGVAVVGRTTTQYYEEKTNHWVMEVRRVATDGTKNACSALYAAAWRMVSAMGYRKLISYTLPEEGGSSLKALGWKLIENVGGNPWAHRSKRGYDIHPTGKKNRWEIEVYPSKVQPFDNLQWPVYTQDAQLTLTGLFETTAEGDGVGQKIEQEKIERVLALSVDSTLVRAAKKRTRYEQMTWEESDIMRVP